MIMQKPSDNLFFGYSPETKIRLVYADVSDSARILEQNHLSGPVAGLIQAEALAGVALLASELSEAQETVTLRITCDGPIEGLLVEAGRNGDLRGYTKVKVINDLDETPEREVADAYGRSGQAQIIRSVPGRVLAHAYFGLEPVSIGRAVESYFQQSLQRRTSVQVLSSRYDDFLDTARGVLIDCLPDGDTAVFERVCDNLGDTALQDLLEDGCTFSEIATQLGFKDMQLKETRAMQFGCRCSAERVDDMFALLPDEDLLALSQQEAPIDIFCHMCGRGYMVQPAFLSELLRRRKDT